MAERADLHGSDGDVDGHSVEETPFERGTDPLGDDAQTSRRSGRLIISCLLVIVFVAMGISDFTTGHTARGILAIVVAVLNGVVAVKERAKPVQREDKQRD